MTKINGSFTDDYLVGTWFNDSLDGYGGFDTLVGGAGADTFEIFASDYNSTGYGYATIIDFSWQELDLINIYSGGTEITYQTFGSDTEIYSNNNLIAVISGQNEFNNGFVFAYDLNII